MRANWYFGDAHLADGRTLEASGRVPGLTAAEIDWSPGFGFGNATAETRILTGTAGGGANGCGSNDGDAGGGVSGGGVAGGRWC